MTKCPRWFWVHCFCCLSSWHTSDPKVIQFSCSTKWMDVGMLPTARLPRSFASIIWTLHFKWPVNGQALISNQNSRCAEWPVRFCKAVPACQCYMFLGVFEQICLGASHESQHGAPGSQSLQATVALEEVFWHDPNFKLAPIPLFGVSVNCQSLLGSICQSLLGGKKITEKVTMAYDSYDIDTLLSRHGAKREGCWDLNFVRLISAPKDSNAFLLSI